MTYKRYLTSKDTPNRRLRKAQRRAIFVFNKKAKKIERRERRLAVVR